MRILLLSQSIERKFFVSKYQRPSGNKVVYMMSVLSSPFDTLKEDESRETRIMKCNNGGINFYAIKTVTVIFRTASCLFELWF